VCPGLLKTRVPEKPPRPLVDPKLLLLGEDGAVQGALSEPLDLLKPVSWTTGAAQLALD
jgi:hypothetical protein